MTTDAVAQLAILADALTEIVDLATADPKTVAPPAQVPGAGRGHRRRSPCRGRDLRGLAALFRGPARRATTGRIPTRGRRPENTSDNLDILATP